MAGTCYAERSLPEMAGYASQMPKHNDGSLHSSRHLVRKDTCSAVGYGETSAFCLKIFPIWFAVSSFKSPKKRRTNTTFHGKQPQPKVFQQKIQGAWKAWHPTFEPLASPPKIEFKSIEVPSSLLAFLACLCFVFLFAKVFVAVLISF